MINLKNLEINDVKCGQVCRETAGGRVCWHLRGATGQFQNRNRHTSYLAIPFLVSYPRENLSKCKESYIGTLLLNCP